MSLRQDLRDFALCLEGAWRDPAWDIEGDVYKTAKGNIFLICTGEDASPSATVKLTPAERAAALALPFVRTASWPRGWITATITSEAEREIALEWVSRSHDLASVRR